MGNTYDAIGADETAWGNPSVTQTLLKKVKSEGFRSIRIPVTWEGRQGGAPDYTIDPGWLAKVRQTVDWALAEDLYFMINLHHDSRMWINQYPTNRDDVLARYTRPGLNWQRRSGRPRTGWCSRASTMPTFSGTTGDDQNYQLLAEFNAEFHRIVRASGGNNATRLLVLPTLYTNAVSTVVNGRPVLYSADSATVRRWDAETGTPWPAAMPS